MGDEPQLPAPPPSDLIASGLVGLIEGLRADVREDISELRQDVRQDLADMTGRVTTIDLRQAETRDLIVEFARSHAGEHEVEAEDRRTAHGQFYDFIRNQELDKARRDGALGVIRFAFELVSKHSGSLVKVGLTLAAVLGIASGSIHLAVGS